MDMGKKIRQLRFRAGLTQEQLAEKLGIGPQSVSKWENAVAMPDISALPLLAEIFGVTVDDLFDLTADQRLNRIENRLDAESELPRDVFMEYEEFLKGQLADEAGRKRAVSLLAFLYWHGMHGYARKAARYAEEAVRSAPNEKDSQWILNYTDGHARWDWNMANHAKAVEFYRGIVEEHPEAPLPYMYLLDNLIADHRADEAERFLDRYSALPGAHPVMKRVYRAYIALARFDEPAADAVMEELIRDMPEDDAALFETAQYCAFKGDYEKAEAFYEKAFAADRRRPRFMDALMGIADIRRIRQDWAGAAEAQDRIAKLLREEWGMTEDESTELREALREKERLLELARGAKKK